jgi:hypothetical protein
MARTYREQPGMLLAAALLVFVPLGLVDVLDERFQAPFEHLDPGDISALEWFELAGAGVLHGAIAMLGEVFYAGVIAGTVTAVRLGKDHTLAHIVRNMPYGRLIVADLVLALLVGVGLILLIVPGLILLGRLALVAPAIEVERHGVKAAMRRSWQLVKGNTVRVLVLVVPILVFEDVLTILVQSDVIITHGESFLGDWAAATVSDLITAPLFALAVVVSFYELRDASESSSARSATPRPVEHPAH